MEDSSSCAILAIAALIGGGTGFEIEQGSHFLITFFSPLMLHRDTAITCLRIGCNTFCD